MTSNFAKRRETDFNRYLCGSQRRGLFRSSSRGLSKVAVFWRSEPKVGHKSGTNSRRDGFGTRRRFPQTSERKQVASGELWSSERRAPAGEC
jgi:hypothetical protein